MEFVVLLSQDDVETTTIELRIVKLAPQVPPGDPELAAWLVDNVSLKWTDPLAI